MYLPGSKLAAQSEESGPAAGGEYAQCVLSCLAPDESGVLQLHQTCQICYLFLSLWYCFMPLFISIFLFIAIVALATLLPPV